MAAVDLTSPAYWPIVVRVTVDASTANKSTRISLPTDHMGLVVRFRPIGAAGKVSFLTSLVHDDDIGTAYMTLTADATSADYVIPPTLERGVTGLSIASATTSTVIEVLLDRPSHLK